MLEPAGLGLLLGGEGGVSSARSLSFSLALQGGADGDDGSERERFHRIFFFFHESRQEGR